MSASPLVAAWPLWASLLAAAFFVIVVLLVAIGPWALDEIRESRRKP